jgi:hypothetical protein
MFYVKLMVTTKLYTKDKNKESRHMTRENNLITKPEREGRNKESTKQPENKQNDSTKSLPTNNYFEHRGLNSSIKRHK